MRFLQFRIPQKVHIKFVPFTFSVLLLQLLNEYLTNKSDTVELLNKVDLYMMPLANPDGYIYTHEEVWAAEFGFYFNNFPTGNFNKNNAVYISEVYEQSLTTAK